MTRDIITNKWFIGAIALLIIFAGACYLWYQYELAYERKKAAVAAEFARQWEKERKAAAKPVTRDGTKAPAESTSPTAEKTVNEVTAEVENSTEAETQQQFETPAANAEIADMPTSPFGFGTYPEVPEGMLGLGGNPYKPIWKHHKWPNIRGAKSHELMSRVAIKLWGEGKDGWVGMGGDENRIYVNYPNTVYVTWGETEDDEGNSIRYITSLSGDPSAAQRIRTNNIARLGRPGPKTAADIPSDIEVKLHSEGGINPYEYLNLPR